MIVTLKKRIARFISLTLAATMILAITPLAAKDGNTSGAGNMDGASTVVLYIDSEIMLVDGEEREVDPGRGTKPIISAANRTLMPIRAVAEALGCNVEWNGNTSVATVSFDGYSVEFWVNNKAIRVNKTTVKNIDVAPVIINDRVMIPIRYIEELGFTVNWEPVTRTVIVANELATRRIAVKMESGKTLSSSQRFGGRFVDRDSDYYLLEYDSREEARLALKELSSLRYVQYAKPQRVLHAAFRSWGVEASGTDKYIEYLEEMDMGEVVHVALLDTGVQKNHVLYRDRISDSFEYDFVNDDDDARDDHGHGTAMAGILAEAGGEYLDIVPIKVLNSKGLGTDTDIARAIRYSVDEGANVIVLGAAGSIPGEVGGGPIVDAIAYAAEERVPVIVPAGNERLSTKWGIAASASDAIVVTAINDKNNMDDYSNFGEEVDFALPGVGITTSAYDSSASGRYEKVTGSSASAALMGAAVSLYRSANPSSSMSKLASFFKSNSTTSGMKGLEEYYGNGRLNFAIDEYEVDNGKILDYIAFNKEEVIIDKGRSTSIRIYAYYTDGTYDNVTKYAVITSSRTNVATISMGSSSATIYGEDYGTSTIRCTKISGFSSDDMPSSIKVIVE